MVALGLAGWLLLPSRFVMPLVFLWAVLNPAFVYPVYFTQIEAWYVPAVCFAVLAWACYWRKPTRVHLLGLALAAAGVLAMRQQGFVLSVVLCLAPLAVPGLPPRERWRQGAIALGMLVASLVPWGVRNAVMEGRPSPFGTRTAAYLAVLNDRRVEFYGIRYDKRFGELLGEYQQRYPDEAEREKVMLRDARRRLFEDPVWLAKAVVWRSIGFYGLLPPGVWAADGPRPTRPGEWGGAIRAGMPRLLLIAVSALGLACRPGRDTAFLAALIGANLSVVVLSSTGGDPRICFPSLPLHLVLGLALFSTPAAPSVFDLGSAYRRNARRAAVALLAAVAMAVAFRLTIGRRHAYRLLREPSIVWSPEVVLDRSRPSLNDVAPGDLREALVGKRVRATYFASNEMYPPKFVGHVPGLPAFSYDPAEATYYAGRWPMGHAIGVSYANAAVERGTREGDAVEVEGIVQAVGTGDAAPFWLKAEKVRRLRRARD